MTLTLAEIKKLDADGIAKKTAELRKDYFEKKQKLLRGEHKDISEFKKIRRTIARLLTVRPAEAPKIVESKRLPEDPRAKKIKKLKTSKTPLKKRLKKE
ncbi:MAG: 50S ribosomal protein L29, partial [Candidatus Margulisbacteria bacterium]|nr:50S ribosomal protein L29 [Candidatus Margulisiibacteriota bacterium]